MRSLVNGRILVQIPVFQEPVFKGEVFLFSLAPIFIVKVDVRALFIFIGDRLWFFMPLEPHHIFGVKSPRLFFKCLSSQVLGFSAFHIVKDKEESFC